jgi:hypothetical protein
MISGLQEGLDFTYDRDLHRSTARGWSGQCVSLVLAAVFSMCCRSQHCLREPLLFSNTFPCFLLSHSQGRHLPLISQKETKEAGASKPEAETAGVLNWVVLRAIIYLYAAGSGSAGMLLSEVSRWFCTTFDSWILSSLWYRYLSCTCSIFSTTSTVGPQLRDCVPNEEPKRACCHEV